MSHRNATAIDHTGFAVSSLEDAIKFWVEGLGFSVQRQFEMGGEFFQQVTGVADPKVKTAIITSPSGEPVELLEYSNGSSYGVISDNPGAIGAAHLALRVNNIETMMVQIEAAGGTARGIPRAIESGARKGTLVVYMSGPDNLTVELMQPPINKMLP